MKIELTVSFSAPAFLGGSDQSAEWRTPPFKALLRQWWRVLVAPRHGYDHRALRQEEGILFGHAWLKEGTKSWASRSRVSLALDRWSPGTVRVWAGDPQISHPEVRRPSIGSHLYLGFGPLEARNGGTGLKKGRSAIEAGESRRLRLTLPESRCREFEKLFLLVHLFGAVGSRSRNGWGSLQIARDGSLLPGFDSAEARTLFQKLSRPLKECFGCTWVHALGRDDGGLLLWWTEERKTWSEVIKDLAEIKIRFRTQFKLYGRGFQERHVLALPVTNHDVLLGSGRWANQIRFKVWRTDTGFQGIVFHLPCAMPRVVSGWSSQHKQMEVWRKVHRLLDQGRGLHRLGACPMNLAPKGGIPLGSLASIASRRASQARGEARVSRAKGLTHGDEVSVRVYRRTDGKKGWQAEYEGTRYPLTIQGPEPDWVEGQEVRVSAVVSAAWKQISFMWRAPKQQGKKGNPGRRGRGGPPRGRRR